jgi:hypothetical protein
MKVFLLLHHSSFAGARLVRRQRYVAVQARRNAVPNPIFRRCASLRARTPYSRRRSPPSVPTSDPHFEETITTSAAQTRGANMKTSNRRSAAWSLLGISFAVATGAACTGNIGDLEASQQPRDRGSKTGNGNGTGAGGNDGRDHPRAGRAPRPAAVARRAVGERGAVPARAAAVDRLHPRLSNLFPRALSSAK